MPRYNKEKLLEEADGYTVASYIGMDIMSRGSHEWILCPGHEKRLGKKDTRMSNCYLTAHGYKCFACGVSRNVFDMVMEYFEYELGKKISFSEAMGIVGDALGGRELYQIDSSENGTHREIHRQLSPYDYEILGLQPHLSFERFMNCGTDSSELDETGISYKKCEDYEDSGLFVFYNYERLSFNTMELEYPKEYKKIITDRAQKKKAEYKRLLKKYGNRNSTGIDSLSKILKTEEISDEFICDIKNCIQKRINRIDEILLEVAPETLNKIDSREDYFSMFG